jgi:hypothetical protein
MSILVKADFFGKNRRFIFTLMELQFYGEMTGDMEDRKIRDSLVHIKHI